MRDDWLADLLKAFDESVSEHAIFSSHGRTDLLSSRGSSFGERTRAGDAEHLTAPPRVLEDCWSERP